MAHGDMDAGDTDRDYASDHTDSETHVDRNRGRPFSDGLSRTHTPINGERVAGSRKPTSDDAPLCAPRQQAETVAAESDISIDDRVQ